MATISCGCRTDKRLFRFAAMKSLFTLQPPKTATFCSMYRQGKTTLWCLEVETDPLQTDHSQSRDVAKLRLYVKFYSTARNAVGRSLEETLTTDLPLFRNKLMIARPL